MKITCDRIANHFTCDMESARFISKLLANSDNIRFVIPGMITFLSMMRKLCYPSSRNGH